MKDIPGFRSSPPPLELIKKKRPQTNQHLDHPRPRRKFSGSCMDRYQARTVWGEGGGRIFFNSFKIYIQKIQFGRLREPHNSKLQEN